MRVNACVLAQEMVNVIVVWCTSLAQSHGRIDHHSKEVDRPMWQRRVVFEGGVSKRADLVQFQATELRMLQEAANSWVVDS